ncbi:riboflavin transporter 2-like isoform X2 [Xiphophorus couchianus]|uniref:riboflavin transporter 2-like isoform X2 n=1 Tax=Xiphophorus couchianus TaxID=32473 RepID=UPI0010167A5D|nr:riboflavin transporter 2-like isoform X2 [Xiphophorus couchianus]
MAVLTHLLAILFGMGSWVSINGLWVELPLIVPQVPEGWYLPSYLSILIQAANVGPLVVTLMHRLRPGVLNEAAVIYVIVAVGAVASFLLAFFWKETVVVAGGPRSLALLVLTFFLATVDCTSSVTFLPFMMRLQPHFLTSYFVGEGLSGLLPALAALVQGVGLVRCVNGSRSLNHSGHGTGRLEAQYQPSNFSAEVFFFFLSAMMLVSLAAFLLLDLHPAVARQQPDPCYSTGSRERFRSSRKRAEQRPMMDLFRPQNHKPRSSLGSSSCSQKQLIFIFVVLGWVNALSNTVLPSVQSYSCLPYGNGAYHLSAALAAVSNPLAGFVAMFVSIRTEMMKRFYWTSSSPEELRALHTSLSHPHADGRATRR